MIAILQALFHRANAVTPTQASQAVDAGAWLLDVREDSEWRAGHAVSARHIALSQLQARLDELPHDRQIITVCRSGRRSAIAATVLRRHGRDAVNLSGGMTAWASDGLPVVTKKGAPGRVA